MEEILRKIGEANPSIEHEDLMEAIPLIQKVKPKVILDIGTHMGGSAKLWIDVFNPDILVTIDSGKIPPGTQVVEGDNYHYLWEHDSTTNETEEAVKKLLDGRDIDFLFLDGGHTFKVVESDVDKYVPLVRKGGMVGMHDIRVNSEHCQVPFIWSNMKQDYKFKEIEKGPHTTGFGLLYI